METEHQQQLPWTIRKRTLVDIGECKRIGNDIDGRCLHAYKWVDENGTYVTPVRNGCRRRRQSIERMDEFARGYNFIPPP